MHNSFGDSRVCKRAHFFVFFLFTLTDSSNLLCIQFTVASWLCFVSVFTLFSISYFPFKKIAFCCSKICLVFVRFRCDDEVKKKHFLKNRQRSMNKKFITNSSCSSRFVMFTHEFQWNNTNTCASHPHGHRLSSVSLTQNNTDAHNCTRALP